MRMYKRHRCNLVQNVPENQFEPMLNFVHICLRQNESYTEILRIYSEIIA